MKNVSKSLVSCALIFSLCSNWAMAAAPSIATASEKNRFKSLVYGLKPSSTYQYPAYVENSKAIYAQYVSAMGLRESIDQFMAGLDKRAEDDYARLSKSLPAQLGYVNAGLGSKSTTLLSSALYWSRHLTGYSAMEAFSETLQARIQTTSDPKRLSSYKVLDVAFRNSLASVKKTLLSLGSDLSLPAASAAGLATNMSNMSKMVQNFLISEKVLVSKATSNVPALSPEAQGFSVDILVLSQVAIFVIVAVLIILVIPISPSPDVDPVMQKALAVSQTGDILKLQR